MSVYWLAPLTSRDPLVIGGQRQKCSGEPFESFRLKVQRLSSSRHLMMFKSDLLLSDEEDLCGDDGAAGLSFNESGDITFSADRLPISHCAEAFFDRLPDAREWRATLQLLADSNQQWSELERVWLHLLTTWTDSEYIIVLLRED
jgi:hypothetical protein